MLTFKKILCPIDLSEASREGLNKAVQLATPSETEICVLHVMPALGQAETIAASSSNAVEHRAEAVRMLSEIIEEIVPSQISSRPLLKEGEASVEIVRAANDEDADLIVLTAHGGQGWKLGELGSVATKVLRSARSPVLTINGPESARVKAGLNRAKTLVAAAASMRPQIEVISNRRLYLDGD